MASQCKALNGYEANVLAGFSTLGLFIAVFQSKFVRRS